IPVEQIFGGDLDAVIVDRATDSAAATCQLAVAKGMARIAAAQLRAFNECKADGLRSGAMSSAGDLQGCHAPADHKRVARAVSRAQRRARTACSRADLSVALPGSCADAQPTQLFECVEGQVRCATCAGLA